MNQFIDLSAAAVLDKLVIDRAEELSQALTSLLQADSLDTQPIFYRYQQHDYLGNSVKIGRWERVYELHGPSYSQATSLMSGHASVPLIVQIEAKQAQREVQEKSQPTFDVMRVMSDSEGPKLAIVSVSTLVGDQEGSLTYRRTGVMMPLEELMQRAGQPKEGVLNACLPPSCRNVFGLLGKKTGYISL